MYDFFRKPSSAIYTSHFSARFFNAMLCVIMLIVVMLNVIMLSVVMLNVIVLSVKNPPSKLFGFYKLSSGLKHVWAFYFLSAREDLESFFKCQVFTLHRQSLWEDLRRKNLLSARGQGPQSSFRTVVESKML